MAKKILFSVLAIIAGLVVITLITELAEILMVSLSSGKSLSEVTKNPKEYFEVRNQPVNIVLKIIYNTAAAFAGGLVCVLIARYNKLKHAMILAAIQIAGFIYGMTISEYANTTPVWLWLVLIAVTTIGIMAAGYIKHKKKISSL